MNLLSHPLPFAFKPNPVWDDSIFSAKAVARGGIIRRAVRDLERELGRAAFVVEVEGRGFHLVDCGGHFIVIGNLGLMKVIC